LEGAQFSYKKIQNSEGDHFTIKMANCLISKRRALRGNLSTCRRLPKRGKSIYLRKETQSSLKDGEIVERGEGGREERTSSQKEGGWNEDKKRAANSSGKREGLKLRQQEGRETPTSSVTCERPFLNLAGKTVLASREKEGLILKTGPGHADWDWQVGGGKLLSPGVGILHRRCWRSFYSTTV